jgi:putative transposase
MPLAIQAKLLSLSRSSLYYVSVEPSAREIAIKHRIDELYTAYPFYGSRKMTVVLCQEGMSVSRPTVQSYMRDMGIAGIAPGPNLSKRNQEHKVYPYLLRGLKIERPNQVWGIDITYIRLLDSWMYLVAILDWFSRYVVSWELDQTLEIPFVVRAVDCALEQAIPEIWNSDQGSQFTSPQYINRLLAADIRISMDGKGRVRDNIFTERLWRTVKYEEVYLNDYCSPREARQRVRGYFDFYNFERPHQSLDYRTPAQIYFKDQLVIKRFLKREKENYSATGASLDRQCSVLGNQC